MPRELIPIFFIGMLGLVGLAFSPIATAIARRIGGAKADPNELAELRADVGDLRAELDDVRSRALQVDELQERLDFAERMLAQVRGQAALPEGH